MSMLAAYLANAGTEELGNLPRQVAAAVSAGVSKDGAQALRDVLPACTTARCALAARSGMHLSYDICSAEHALTASFSGLQARSPSQPGRCGGDGLSACAGAGGILVLGLPERHRGAQSDYSYGAPRVSIQVRCNLRCNRPA